MSDELVGPVPPVRRAVNLASGPAIRTRDVVVGVNCGFDGIEGTDEAVAALMRLEPSKTTNRGERGVTAFDHESHGVTLQVLIVGLTYLSGGENASELEKTILGVVELGLRVVPRVHQAHKRAGVDFSAWNTNS